MDTLLSSIFGIINGYILDKKKKIMVHVVYHQNYCWGEKIKICISSVKYTSGCLMKPSVGGKQGFHEFSYRRMNRYKTTVGKAERLRYHIKMYLIIWYKTTDGYTVVRKKKKFQIKYALDILREKRINQKHHMNFN